MRYAALVSALCILALSKVHAQWERDIRLTENDSASSVAIFAARSIAATGDFVHVVWTDDADQYPDPRAQYARSTDRGLSWETALPLSSDTFVSFDVSVAADSGRVHVAWLDLRSGQPQLYYKNSQDNGATWSADRWLSDNAREFSGPCIATAGPDVHLVWTGLQNDTLRVYHKRSPDYGMSWGADVALSTDRDASAFGSVCALDLLVHVAWYAAPTGAGGEVFYRRSTDRGLTWQPQVQLTGGSVGTGLLCPQIAASEELVHIASTHRPVDRQEAVYLRSPNRGESWGAAHRVFSTPGEDVGRATVAADGENVHFAATLVDSGTTRVHYAVSTNGGLDWDVPGRLSDTGPSAGVSLALAGNSVYAFWQDSRDGNQEVYFKRNPTGNIGIEEMTNTELQATKAGPTMVRGVLLLSPLGTRSELPGRNSVMSRAALLDAAGRKVLSLVPGPNDVSGLTPGVYFVLEAQPQAQAQAVRKVIIQR